MARDIPASELSAFLSIDPAICWQAIYSRDRRGRFFTAATTREAREIAFMKHSPDGFPVPVALMVG
jgi:hypothetical protein